MKQLPVSTLLPTVLAAAACTGCSTVPTSQSTHQPPAFAAAAGAERVGFGVNGALAGSTGFTLSLQGGGSFAPGTASDLLTDDTGVAGGGGFECLAPISQGPLAGCGAGDRGRWKAVHLLATTGFRCSGTDAARSAGTTAGTAVLLVEFYREGDGAAPSFTARAFVSDTDLAEDLPGSQTLWVQGVGCGDAAVQLGQRPSLDDPSR